MRDKEKDAAQMAIKRRRFLEKAYELFTRKKIESVSMIEVARACGYGTMTLYRYFSTKPQLVVAVAAWIWGEDHPGESGAQAECGLYWYDRVGDL